MDGSFSDFNDVWGNDQIIDGLKRAVDGGRVGHAYLLTGPGGVGKANLARALAAALLCGEPHQGAPCGSCNHCRYIKGGGHPDLHEVFADGASFKIDQVRELRHQADLRPYLAGRQVFVVHDAGLFTEQAANSFLKLLEEPPGGVHFILLANRPGAVLPTILSRCQLLTLRPMAGDKLEQRLASHYNGLTPEEAKWAAVQSGGLPEKAKSLAAPEARARLQEEAAAVLRVMRGNLPDLLKLAEELDKNRPGVEKLLENLALWLGEALRASGRGQAWSQGPFDESDCRDYNNPAVLAGLMDEIAEARRLLRQNVNTRLTLDVLFIGIWNSRRKTTPHGAPA